MKQRWEGKRRNSRGSRGGVELFRETILEVEGKFVGQGELEAWRRKESEW